MLGLHCRFRKTQTLIYFGIMDITVVIPLYNEEESLPELHAWIKRVMEEHKFSYEIVFVNDGSTDRSWDVIEDLVKKDPNVKHQVSP